MYRNSALIKSSALYRLPMIFLLLYMSSCPVSAQLTAVGNDSIHFVRIESDSIFNSPQQICLLILNRKAIPPYIIDIAAEDTALLKTSRIGESNGALAAINGSFFDMDKGGSVCYIERRDSVRSRTRDPDQKWGVSNRIINAALVLDTGRNLRIEPDKSELHYEFSDAENFVMKSGPLLIQDSMAQPLPDMAFSHKRHPRTCIGITKESIIFITVDGRSERAAGMTLVELQHFLLQLGCRDAMNLDGGGSTTMWIREEGIVNEPSDRTGERAVADALLILKD